MPTSPWLIGVRATRADVVWRVAERVCVDKQVKGSDVDGRHRGGSEESS
jgi:hypothetical protein